MNNKLISNYMKFSIILIMLLYSAIIGCIEYDDTLHDYWNPSFSIQYKVNITKVIDGDTIKAVMPSGEIGTIRFLGVDTPELQDEHNVLGEYETISNVTCLTYYGYQAKEFVKEKLNQNICYIEFDEQAGIKDTYNRWLCYIYLLDNTDLNMLLLENGFARTYESESFFKKEVYKHIEYGANEENKGLWGCS